MCSINVVVNGFNIRQFYQCHQPCTCIYVSDEDSKKTMTFHLRSILLQTLPNSFAQSLTELHIALSLIWSPRPFHPLFEYRNHSPGKSNIVVSGFFIREVVEWILVGFGTLPVAPGHILPTHIELLPLVTPPDIIS